MLVVLLLLSVIFIVLSTTCLKLHPFLALLVAAFGFGLLAKMPMGDVVASVNEGFGGTLGYIGLVIVAGTIIGTFLEKSGGAYAIAQKVLSWVGEKGVALAMGIIGYIVSIPVFCDSGFVILSPLNKALSAKAKRSLAGSAIALALGLLASHTMVPPTPGPVAAAGIIGVDVGHVMLIGIPVSLLSLSVCWIFAKIMESRIYIDPNPDASEADIEKALSTAPSAGKAMLPILIPVILIVLKSVAVLPSKPLGENTLTTVIAFAGEPVVALLIGVALSLLLPKHLDRNMLSASGWVGKALTEAAIILLITGAGGAFGKVLQNSGIADVLSEWISGASLGIWLPFLIASAVKTAQGSSTVAIITTASIIAPLAAPMGFESGTDKALMVLAVGAGSAVVSHANDSFFWVVTQLSGFDVKNGYRLHSLGTLILGLSAAFFIWLISLF